MPRVAVSTPGKLILMGEHAAVYGRPALVAAVDLRLTVLLSPAASGIHLDLPGLGHTEDTSWEEVRRYAATARELWGDYSRHPDSEGFKKVRGDDPAHVVKTALGEAAAFLGEPEGPPLSLRIDSGLPIGSGFGSSAATAVGVLAGYLYFRTGGAAPADVQRLALEVERRQHGLPSGVDGATVLHGGVLWARKLASGGLESTPVEVRSPVLARLQVYNTGTPPEPTGAVVAAVRDRRDRDPLRHELLLDRMEAATRAFRDELARELEEPHKVRQLLREHQACQEELGVVPEPVRALVRQVEAEGGAAKISGAGSLAGPGAGSLLVYHPQPDRVAGWSFLQPFPFHPVHLGALGFRREVA